ncbi:hypothetical protein C8R44DRAFT_895258 [Mycena epipterygia]|nr:hypothetical protein C8R44DRAFT_895258 [Mycena epipterygia]
MHPRRLPDPGDKCRLQCVRLPCTQDVRGLVRLLPRAHDAARDCSHLCAATVAHEAIHHAAASTPASLRHRRKADGSAYRTHPGQGGSETTTESVFVFRCPQTPASSRAPAYDSTYRLRASIHCTPNAYTIGSTHAPRTTSISPTQDAQCVAATAYASPRTTAHTVHRRPPRTMVSQTTMRLPHAFSYHPCSTCALVNIVHPLHPPHSSRVIPCTTLL